MASGRPTIGANVGAVPEIIEDGKTGFLVRNRDSDELAARAVDLLTDPGLRERMGLAARERAQSHFTETARARAVLEIYNRVLQKKFF